MIRFCSYQDVKPKTKKNKTKKKRKSIVINTLLYEIFIIKIYIINILQKQTNIYNNIVLVLLRKFYFCSSFFILAFRKYDLTAGQSGIKKKKNKPVAVRIS